MKILLINGPNLNLLGSRETEIYGHKTLTELVDELTVLATEQNLKLSSVQSNAEAELIDALHQAQKNKVEFIIINPAALTHSSIALRDAFLAINIPFIEVHLSNIYAREAFRHHSYLSDIAQGIISGFGFQGYHFALNAANHFLQQKYN